MPFWNAIIAARATWTEVDMQHAANLARCQADIEKIQKELDKEGPVTQSARGSNVMNPKFTALEVLTRRSVMLSRMIQVHTAATLGESKDNRGKNAAKHEAESAMNSMTEEDEELIGTPNIH